MNNKDTAMPLKIVIRINYFSSKEPILKKHDLGFMSIDF